MRVSFDLGGTLIKDNFDSGWIHVVQGNPPRTMKRETGLEPATSSLGN